MAFIKKSGARKELERDIPSAFVTNHSEDGGLRFGVQIGSYRVSLTHMERDVVIEQWANMQKEHEK